MDCHTEQRRIFFGCSEDCASQQGGRTQMEGSPSWMECWPTDASGIAL
jgi:hypothetical protein